MLRTCYEYVPRLSCISVERTKNCCFSGRTQRHSLPQNASSAQPRRQFVPQAFFRKFSNIMFVAAAAAVPQNTFHSLYQPWNLQLSGVIERRLTLRSTSVCFVIAPLYVVEKIILGTFQTNYVCDNVYERGPVSQIKFPEKYR